MESKLTTEDKTWINAGKDATAQAVRKTAILNLYEMNGIKFDAGIGKSYIPDKNFFQLVADKTISEAANTLATNALNWHALGRGIGGLAGAGVRYGVASLMDPTREYTVHEKYTDDIDTIVTDYVAFSTTKKDVFPFWNAQAYNVLGLAAAIFNREMHHWNAENTRPQLALLAALNQQDTIPEGDLRKLFYLSIHPVPLSALEEIRSKIVAGKVPGINDAVASRCRSAPAGAGDIHACAQAITDLTSEAFYGEFGKNIKSEINYLLNLNQDIITHAGAYHAFAANYGKERIPIDRSRCKRAMIALCAYIFVNIKGSLAASAALKKFKNSNARMVQKWMAAFEVKAGEDDPKLADLAAD